MKTATYMILKNQLLDHPYSLHGEYDVDKLFKIYASFEYTNFIEVLKTHLDFYDFVKYNVEMFQGCRGNSPESQTLQERIISRAKTFSFKLDSIHNENLAKYRINQEIFAKTSAKIIGKSKAKVLEVGSGEIPYSSILLAHEVGHIDSMDKFILPDRSLESLDITPHNRYFDKDFDISQFDIVIGQRPCSAIKDIAMSCADLGKSYFLELCECNSPNYELSGWKDYLKTIDPNVKFSSHGSIAYNLKGLER